MYLQIISIHLTYYDISHYPTCYHLNFLLYKSSTFTFHYTLLLQFYCHSLPSYCFGLTLNTKELISNCTIKIRWNCIIFCHCFWVWCVWCCSAFDTLAKALNPSEAAEGRSLSEVDGVGGATIQVISRDQITPLIEVEGPLLTDTHVSFKVCTQHSHTLANGQHEIKKRLHFDSSL